MRYATRMIPTTLLVIAATAVGVACSSASDENEGATAAALRPGGNNPSGNNGTVKIQEVGDPLEIPDNDPHVGCAFQIEFRGFDQGDLNATWALEGQAPTGKGVAVVNGTKFIGGDPAGGANDVDGIQLVDLTQVNLMSLLGPEHPQQGYHLKLTVHAEGSRGADTKHKVFWVKGCNPPPPPPPPDAGADCEPPPPPPPPPCCGDGHLDPGEECDLGKDNGKWGSTCTDDCKLCPPPPPPPCDHCTPTW